jgi:hypothetical protein
VQEYYVLQDEKSKFGTDICSFRVVPTGGREEGGGSPVEIDNLRREKDALEQTLAEKQQAEVTWMSAKLSAVKDAERLRDENNKLRKRIEEMTHPD